MKRLIMLATVLILSSPVGAQPLVWVSPDWEADEPARSRKSLMFDILNAIYEPLGYEILYQQFPLKRAQKMLLDGEAQLLGATPSLQDFAVPYYPIINQSELVMYRVARIDLSDGVEGLQGLFGVWPALKNDALTRRYPFLEGMAVDSSAEAFSLLISGTRPIDYYIDTSSRMAATMEKSLNVYEPGDFAIGQLSVEPHYILFARTTEGVLLRKLFENGIKTLYCSGDLVDIYDGWATPMPDISPSC
ncbi:substrate-binding periplasmic protein [Alteromonas sp. H39]|uniref:substrate-binding periplasmic protein n=1 Tax=Alteromonas sp. H39 TaxID=3389876 RepID=UPI0039E02CD9